MKNSKENGSDELAEYLKKAVENAGPFKPYVWYNKDGNQIEIYWDDESDYGKEVKGEKFNIACLMIGQDTGKIVGLNIYSIKQILERAGFKLVPIEEEK